MPALAQLLAGGLSLFSPHNGTMVATESPDMVPQYAVVTRFEGKDCSGASSTQASHINACFKNSYLPGTYNIKCDANKKCAMYVYPSMDCSGTGKAAQPGVVLDGKCIPSPQGQGSAIGLIKTGTSAATATLKRPLQFSWQTGDNKCSGAPTTISELGTCRDDGHSSYKHECDSTKKVVMCQYLNTTTCSGFKRCEGLPSFNPTGKCNERRHFGGAASVEFTC